MNSRIPVMVCALAAASAAVHAGGWSDEYGRRSGYGRDSGAYVGLGVGQLRYSEDGLDTITPTTAMVTIGAPLSPNLAIEGRLGGGIARAETNTYGVEVRSLFAGYLKGSLPLAPGFSFYGLAGLASVDLRRDFGLVDSHDSGISYGLGMDFSLEAGTHLNLEWTRLATGNNLGYDYSVDMASIGVAWRF
jgi:opacity protein-like surface antigen